MPDELIYANGISGLTGEYLIPPLQVSDLAMRAKEPHDDPEVARELEGVWEALKEPTFGLPFNVYPENVAEARWAIVFHSDEADAVKHALGHLIKHRRRQVGIDQVKVLDYLPGEQWAEWLHRHGTAPGNVDPAKVPYYILLVGSPSRIPFAFQYLLDVEYAVGRLHFDDVDGYRRYVTSLVDYEEAAATPHDKAAAFFGTRHPFDGATQLSADLLVQPLAGSFQPGGRFADTIPGYHIHPPLLEQSATKAALGEILTGTGPLGRPALLFSATHGMGGWPPGHPDQRARHGALLCQDWPGLGQVSSAQYLAASDVPADACVHGLVACFFACYGAGTPQADPFWHKPGGQPPIVAEEPFVAALPQRLLAHPEGGALAVIGHIDRAWGYSFLSGGKGQLLPFQNAIGRILSGQPVGYAMKDFNEKYAALSANISDILEQIGVGKLIPDTQLARLWTERNDAQNYVVLGDPAATLKVT
ncbi:MAG: C25 family cysteine peptidase [Isosphaeraceae bacterium]